MVFSVNLVLYKSKWAEWALCRTYSAHGEYKERIFDTRNWPRMFHIFELNEMLRNFELTKNAPKYFGQSRTRRIYYLWHTKYICEQSTIKFMHNGFLFRRYYQLSEQFNGSRKDHVNIQIRMKQRMKSVNIEHTECHFEACNRTVDQLNMVWSCRRIIQTQYWVSQKL